jgi:hypothetical protein
MDTIRPDPQRLQDREHWERHHTRFSDAASLPPTAPITSLEKVLFYAGPQLQDRDDR